MKIRNILALMTLGFGLSFSVSANVPADQNGYTHQYQKGNKNLENNNNGNHNGWENGNNGNHNGWENDNNGNHNGWENGNNGNHNGQNGGCQNGQNNGNPVGAPIDGGLLTILGAAGVAYVSARKKKKGIKSE